MSGSNDGTGSWGSRFLKVASAAAATAAVAGGLYALLSSSSSSSVLEVPFGTQREGKERDDLSSYRGESTPSILQVYKGDPFKWKKPEFGWVKLNVDGSREHHKVVSAGCGGVLRDASGEWLLGFAQKLNPIYEAPQTELQAILKGLELAWKVKFVKNIENLVVESDCDPALSMVKNGVKINHEDYDVVKRIRELCSHPNWQVKLVSISNSLNQKKGKANAVADRLAKDARDFPFYDLKEYHYPPNETCIELLSEDKQGRVSF